MFRVHRLLLNGLVVSAMLGAPPNAGAQASAPSRLLVGPNVHVSTTHSGDPNYEVIAAADPRDASRVLIGAIHRRADLAGTTAYVTNDGGETWTATLYAPPPRADGAVASDPAVLFDARGTAYFVTSLLPPNSSGPTRRMLLYRSADGGKSWKAPVFFTYSDRQYIAVDDSGGQHNGRVYVAGNSRVGDTSGHATLLYSKDGGETFSEARGPKMPVSPVMGNVALLSDGTVIVLHSVSRGKAERAGEVLASLRVNRSRDGGESLEEPIDVAAVNLVAGRKGAHNNTLAMPFMAADASAGPYKDRLYVVWPEFRDGHTEIFLSRSGDAGRTWSSPQQVSDSPAPRAGAKATDQFMATAAVNRDGVLGILWYDRRDCPDNIGWDVRFTASLDGGETFLPSVRVSEVGNRFGSQERWIAEATTSKREGEPGIRFDASLDTFTFLGGDTAGLAAAADGRFHVAWVENSTGTPQVWTAPVTVRPASTESRATGDAGAAGEEDVTALATVETVDSTYDRGTNLLRVRVRIVNTSQRSLAGPLRMRMTTLTSELGKPRALNADRGGPGAGAEWDVVTPSSSGLRPGERSRMCTLAFELQDIAPYLNVDRYRRGLVRGSVSILGGRAPEPR